MTSTKEAPGPYDALERAEPGELIFTLLARDFASSGSITEWARIRRNHFLRRMKRGERRGRPDVVPDIISGGAVAMAGLLISSAGGPNGLDDGAFDKWISIATFAWFQAISCFDGGAGHA